MQLRPALTVCLTTAVLAEVMRVSFPLMYDFAGDIGFATAAGLVPLMFATALVAAPVGRLAGPQVLLAVGGGGLAVTRVVMQVQSSPGLPVAVAGTLLGLVGLSAALRRSVAAGRAGSAGSSAGAGSAGRATGAGSAGRATGAATSAALFLGLTIDTCIRLALTTWDAAWQSTPFAWLVGLALPALLGWSIVAELRAPERSMHGVDSTLLAVLPGPLLALEALFLANPGFVASSGRVDLPLAGGIVLVGLATAAVMPVVWRINAWIARIWLVAIAALLTGPTGATGAIAWVGVVAGQACIGALVTTTCTRAASRTPSCRAVRTGLGAGLSSLALVGVLLPYYISYEIPLGIPQLAVAAAGAMIVVGITWPEVEPPAAEAQSRAAEAQRARRVAMIALLAGLVVPLWSALTWPEPSASPASAQVSSAQVRAATYNIHSAISWDGRLDPEGIARVLEDGDATSPCCRRSPAAGR